MRRDRIYRVRFEQKWPREGWSVAARRIDILANGKVERAIAAARRYALAETFENEKGRTVKCSDFRLVSVEVIATAEIEG